MHQVTSVSCPSPESCPAAPPAPAPPRVRSRPLGTQPSAPSSDSCCSWWRGGPSRKPLGYVPAPQKGASPRQGRGAPPAGGTPCSVSPGSRCVSARVTHGSQWHGRWRTPSSLRSQTRRTSMYVGLRPPECARHPRAGAAGMRTTPRACAEHQTVSTCCGLAHPAFRLLKGSVRLGGLDVTARGWTAKAAIDPQQDALVTGGAGLQASGPGLRAGLGSVLGSPPPPGTGRGRGAAAGRAEEGRRSFSMAALMSARDPRGTGVRLCRLRDSKTIPL